MIGNDRDKWMVVKLFGRALEHAALPRKVPGVTLKLEPWLLNYLCVYPQEWLYSYYPGYELAMSRVWPHMAARALRIERVANRTWRERVALAEGRTIKIVD